MLQLFLSFLHLTGLEIIYKMKQHIAGYAGYTPGKKTAALMEPIHREQQAEIVGKQAR